MKISLRLIWLILLFSFACASRQSPSLLGTWSGENDGGKMTFTFKENHEAEWIVQSQWLTDTVAIKYSFDSSKTPQEIELSDFDHGPLQGKIMFGIVEFTDKNTFKMDLEPGNAREEKAQVQPRSFTNDTVVFKKVNDSGK